MEQSIVGPQERCCHLAVEHGDGVCDTDKMGNNLGDSLGVPKRLQGPAHRGLSACGVISAVREKLR